MLDKKVVSQCISSDYCRGWNDAVDAMPRWISVEERLPEDGKNVLIFVKCMNNWWHIEVDWRIGGCWFNNAETDWNKITHWMPLPEPPEEGKE